MAKSFCIMNHFSHRPKLRPPNFIMFGKDNYHQICMDCYRKESMKQ